MKWMKMQRILSLIVIFFLTLNFLFAGSVHAEPEPGPIAAPTIDSSHSTVFTAIDEDSLGNEGMLISDMVGESITSNTASVGIAVFGMTGQGSWEAYYNNIWWNMSPLTPETASLLKSDMKLRFVPAADWNGTATISYRAWDIRVDLPATDGGRLKYDVTQNGGNTAYSADTQTSSIVVNPVNDVPRVIFPKTSKLLNFNGTTDFVTVNNLTLKNEMTFEAWVYDANPHAAWSRLFDFGNGAPGQNIMVGFYQGSGQMFLHNYTMGNETGEIIVEDQFPANQWVHVEVMIDDQGIGSIYWDGVLKANGEVGPIVDVHREINYIGRSHWGQDAYFNGKIRDIRFWNFARTPEEIAADKDEILTGNEPGLVGYMPMLESEGTYLNDLTGKDISGNIIEADWVKDTDAPLAVTIQANTTTEELLHGIYTTDPDAEDTPGGKMTLRITVPRGSIHLNTGISAVNVTAGANDSTTLTLRGNKSAIDSAVGTLLYTPPLGFFGTVKMDFAVNDEGNSGQGGSLNSERSLYVVVLPVSPEITPIPDQEIVQDEATQELPFILSGGLVPADQATITVESSNTQLLPSEGIKLGGAGKNRTIQLTPAAGQFGQAVITVTVSDGRTSATTSFDLIVVDPGEDFTDGRVEFEGEAPIYVTGDPVTLGAKTSLRANKVTAKLGDQVYELTLANSSTYFADGFKLWKLDTTMPFIINGEQMAEFTAYSKNGTALAPELEESYSDNYFTLYTPAAGVTAAVYNIDLTTASVTTEIARDGGKPITERGIIYGTADNLTVEIGTKVINGEVGISPFATSLTNLNPNTVYYVRSYVITELGIVYSPVQQFRTRSVFVPTPEPAPAAPAQPVNVTVPLVGTSGTSGSASPITSLIGSKLPVSGQLFSIDGKALSGLITMGADGSLVLGNIAPGEYHLALTVTAPNGEILAGQMTKLTVDSNGKTIFNVELIDPYGIITDRVTGKPVNNVKTTLYWMDTELNRSKGRTPGGEVVLPGLPDFAPNKNINPQISTEIGEYGWMVPADGDYYIVAEQGDYEIYDSRKDKRNETYGIDSYIKDGIIHVGKTIVPYSFAIDPKLIASGEHAPYLNGYPDGHLKPERGLSRAELAVILSRVISARTEGVSAKSFADIQPKHWASKEIVLAAEQGWMSGYSGGGFAPERQITRAELVQALYNIGKWSSNSSSSYSDVKDHWAFKAISAAEAAGLLAGFPDGTFKPDKPVTRAEAVKIINKFLNHQPWRIPVPAVWDDVPVTYWGYSDVMEASVKHSYKRYATGTESWEE